MEQNIADFLNNTFPETDFEHVHFDDDIETEHSDDTPQRQPAMEDNHNYRDASKSALDFAQIQSLTNADKEEEMKNCYENSEDCSLDEQTMKTGSTVCESWDDNNSVENKMKAQDQQLNVHDEECKESEFEIRAETSDLHQMEKDQAEYVSLLQLVPPKEIHNNLGAEYHMVMEEATSHLLSCQMLDKLENIMDPEHVFQYASDDNNFSGTESELHDCPIVSTEDESGDEMKEFTEDDHERVEEGLADYPSDLSQSENEGSSESHEGRIPKDMSSKLSETEVVHCFHEIENIATTSTYMATFKNEELDVEAISGKYDAEHDCEHVCVNDQFLNDSLETEKDSRRVSDFGEISNFGNPENFQSIAQMGISGEGYINEQPDYDSDISSDGDYNKCQEEKWDPISRTCEEVKNIALPEQEHTFTKDITRDWNSIESNKVDIESNKVDIEDTVYQNPGICDVIGLSGIPTSPGAEMEDSSMEACSVYGINSCEIPNSSKSELKPSESSSVKLEQNDNSEPLEVLDVGENINTFLPETFLSLMAEDNLKLDEYDWDINGEEVICDEEDDFLDELENYEEETERDWEKERARIEAFNRYYKSVEGEVNEGRSHKVKFCLDPESCQYEEDSDSEEEVSCISELHSSQSSSVRPDQSNKEHNHEPLEVSDTGENISNLEPETLWPSTLLMDEDNLKLNEYDHDINGDDLDTINSTKVICNEKLMEELENVGQKTEMDWEQEQARIEAFNRYYEESVGREPNYTTDRGHRVTLNLDQESSQYQENNDDSSEQESNTEDEITSNIPKTEDQSESDEPQERRSYKGRLKIMPKGLQKPGQKLKKQAKSNRYLVLLKSVLAVSLATVVGVLSYWWATDSLDWIY
ncbi:uncharacterized protein si:dkey-183p4.10 isoform X3 [Myxocyprinus asiaticus]|uniref:uncharacterized protein si:dkey-183p4.10 isoform X3 n=1 Tax=Myxocyprinus asiaticus TaxID=70543 RepID=UPI002221F00F|nr:uncharacterized protein si:dkey-183p4.10 isoform X3 [Myxocyprinus asiaticus]